MKIHIGNYHKDATKPRKVKVEIKGFDLYSLDHTLALIILPCLKAFHQDPVSYPSEFGHLKAWKRCLEKMIRAFEILSDDTEFIDRNSPAVKEGLELFAKYYLHLWR